ncbi:unnamed protein product [Effrenium voratum]|uniref:EXS domain-containing protein n=1 Tax=Effrenium voratum TaxID=2562239 RepID=A0AA36HJF5_9DINO|nr:unnamed protein product [Effrenium voratum]
MNGSTVWNVASLADDIVKEKSVQALWTVIRPGYMVAVFLLGWAMNVSLFNRFRIDYAAVLNLSKEELVSPRFLVALATLLALCLSLVRVMASWYGASIELLAGVLAWYLLALLAVVGLLPRMVAKHSRWREPFSQALWRCVWPETSKEIPFVEVLVADGLTSLAKLFFDVSTGVCIVSSYQMQSSSLGSLENFTALEAASLIHKRQESAGAELAAALDVCSGSPVPYIAWSVPFLIRARQCIITARHAPDALTRDLQRVNLAKYLSALPVVFFAMCHARVVPGVAASMLGPEDFEVLWALAAVVNSVFGFLWDLVMDWGLLHLTPNKPTTFGLRPQLLYPVAPALYYLMILLNFIGRTLWSLRWSEHATIFLGSFFLSSCQQGAEVVRRCLWNLMRVEWQCIVKGKFPRPDKIFPV